MGAVVKKSDVPEAIQKQAEAADAAQKKLSSGVETAKPDSTPKPPEKKPEEKKPEETWEHKYKVLDGMFKAELAKRDSKIEELSSTVQHLTKLLEEKPEEEEEPAATALDPEEFEGYGDEMLDMVKTVNELVEQNQKLKAENAKLIGHVEQVGKTVVQTNEEKFVDGLTAAVKDWRIVNKDSGWLAWLDNPDPLTGIRRQAILDDAYSKFDVKRVAKLFETFKKETGWVEKEVPGIENEVVPDTAAAPSSATPPDEGKVTPAEFAQASKDFTMGRITQEEYRKITENFQKSLRGG